MKTISKRITLTLTLLSLAFVIVSMSIFIGISYFADLHSLKRSTLRNTATTAKSISNNLNCLKESVAGAAKLVESLSEELSIQEKVEILDKLIISDNLKEIGLVDIGGTGYKMTKYNNNIYQINLSSSKDSEYFTISKKGEYYFSPPFANGNDFVMLISAPIYNNNQISGVVYIVQNVEHLNQYISEINYGLDGYSFVVSKNNRLYFHPNTEMVKKGLGLIVESDKNPISGENSFAAKLTSGQAGIVMYNNKENIQVLTAYCPIKDYPQLVFASAIDLRVFNRHQMEKSLIFVISGLVILLLIFIAIKYISKTISEPIKRLSKRISLLASGDLETPVVKINSFDELKTIQEALSSTISWIKNLDKSREIFNILTEGAEETVFTVDVSNDTLSVDAGDWFSLTGKPTPSSYTDLGHLYIDSIHPDDLDGFRNQFGNLRRIKNEIRDFVSTDFRIKLQNGDYTWFKGSETYLRYKDGQIYKIVGRIVKIHEQRLKEIDLEKESKKDRFTGVYNKATFEALASEHFEYNISKYNNALIIIDIDNLKHINDSMGHLVGDETIRMIARVIKDLFSGNDIVGRIGGDEFAVLIKEMTSQKVIELKLDSLLRSIAQIGEEINCTHGMGASIGVAISPRDGNDYKTLYKNADNALYIAKKLGKNRYIFYNSSL